MSTGRAVLTVSELTRRLQETLEERFPAVWIEGEISNYRLYGSGHAYFTLKDADAQIRAVLFRNRGRRIKFEPADGLHVMAFGSIEVYPQRGEYQLVIELLEPKGLGALQLAFEQLKARLQAEGLFDHARKRELPRFPRKIGIVTSPSGAAIRDMLRVIDRRFGELHIVIAPCRVQGDGAAEEIAQGLRDLNALGGVDIIIVGRGGGSLEDLWAFNEEAVARAIAASKVPVVSAVGHEVDFTISDFVADLRAPTPSAAAELVVREKQAVVDSLGRERAALRSEAGSMRARVELLTAAEERARRLAQELEELRGENEFLNQELARANPDMMAVLEQRIGRVDRLGQSRTVHAINLFAHGTAESVVLARLVRRMNDIRKSLPSFDNPVFLRTEADVATEMFHDADADAGSAN